MKILRRFNFIFLLTLLIIQHAHSETITFNDVVSPVPFSMGSGLPYEQAGYQITDLGNGVYAFIPPNATTPTNSPLTGWGPASDSVFLSFCTCFDPGLSISRTDGQLFTLNSLDVGIGYYVFAPGNLVLTVQRADSSIFNFQFSITDPSWQNISLTGDPNFSNIKSFSIGGVVGSSIAVDNINVSQVPVPAAIWLYGSGLFGLARYVRNRKLS